MLLVIDVGNTNITLGLYRGEELTHHWRTATDHERTTDEYAMLLLNLFAHAGCDPRTITGIAIASVVPPLTGVIAGVSREYFRLDPLLVDAGVKTGVRVRYDNPREVGADRVADAAAAHKIYGGPACIVDFGTGTTFDAISADGDYLGGAIAPGIAVAAEALFSRAAKLPRVSIARPPNAIGTNSVHSLQSGLLFGYVGLVEGMVARFRRELGANTKVIGTGGLAELVAQETQVIEILDPWLTLKGLRIIYELNREPIRV
jgi:type III pantothenate kinase